MSKVTILSKPNRIVIASKGVQGPPGEDGVITPELEGLRDEAQQAAQAAAGSASTASDAAGAAVAAQGAAEGSAGQASASAALAEQARLLGATIGFATKADMDASLAHPDGTLALVTNDANPESNGTYRKTGASGSGSWVQSADRVTGLETGLHQIASKFNKHQTVGRSSVSSTATGVSSNTRILADPVQADGIIRIMRRWAVGTLSSMTVRRFTKSGVAGTVSIGDVFTQVGEEVIVPAASAGEVVASLDIEVQAGDYIGFFNGGGAAYGQIVGTTGPAYVTAATAGNHAALTAATITSSNQLQIGFDVEIPYLSVERVAQIEQTQETLVASAPEVVSGVPSIPAPAPGKIAIVGSEGPAWSDGVSWRWFSDNEALLLAWNRLVAQAQDDGWSVVYDIGNPHARVLIDDTVAQVSTPVGSKPPVTAGATRPALSTIGGLSSAANSGGASSAMRSSAFANAISPPFTIMMAVDVASPATNQIAADGISTPNRVSIMLNSGKWTLFSGSGQFESVDDAESGPAVISADYGSNSCSMYVDGELRVSAPVAGYPLAGLTLGDRYVSDGRYWRGEIGPVFIYEGTPSEAAKIRLHRLLSEIGEIDIPVPPITSLGACTLLEGDSTPLIDHDADTQLGIASIAKWMGALVAVDHIADIDQTVTVIAEDVTRPDLFDLRAGDEISYRDLIATSVIPSDNDAANCLGRVIGESLVGAGTPTERFVSAMNDKASALGMQDFVFSTPSGLGITEATPRDVCKLAFAFTDDPALSEIGGSASWDCTVAGPNARTYTVTHSVSPEMFPGWIAGKTGTADYLFNLVVVWEYEGKRYASAALGSSSSSERNSNVRAQSTRVMWDLG